MVSGTNEHSGACRYRAPALEKGLDILELLAEHPEGMTQADIARGLERSVGEIFRMLNCLLDRGYLAMRKPGDRYLATLKLFELAYKNPPHGRLLANAAPLMKDLTLAIHQSCHLTVIEGGHGVVIAQVDSPSHIGFSVRMGSVMHLVSSASGRVLLAMQLSEERKRVLDRAAEDGGPGVDKARFEAALSPIRQRGYEEMESTRVRGVHDLSFPVFDQRGSAVAALTVPFIQRLDIPGDSSLDAARTALRRAAHELTLSIGGQPAVREGAGARREEAARDKAQETGRSGRAR